MWLFLDDKRKNPIIVHNDNRGLGLDVGKSDKWVYARNYNEFISIVQNNFDQIEFISFDHDIDSWIDNPGESPIELTGKNAAQFVIDHCIDHNTKMPDWFVHSDNPAGNKNIRSLLMNYMVKFEKTILVPTDAFGYFNGEMYFHL